MKRCELAAPTHAAQPALPAPPDSAWPAQEQLSRRCPCGRQSRRRAPRACCAMPHLHRWFMQDEDGATLELWSLPWATRLIDFGLSKNGVARSSQSAATASIDMHSLPWMAPEMILGSQHLQSSDVWGLGMVLWELLTTHSPPARALPAFVPGSLSSACADTPRNPCEAALVELLELERDGKSAALIRKLHGVPCPVLREVVDLIRATQRIEPSDRISAAEVAARLAELESQCREAHSGLLLAPEDQGLARYWMEFESVSEEELLPFSSTSSLGWQED
jgi:serine/threonine protein kinase